MQVARSDEDIADLIARSLYAVQSSWPEVEAEVIKRWMPCVYACVSEKDER